MSRPRKFRKIIAWDEGSWTIVEFTKTIAFILTEIPDEHLHTARVEMVFNDWGEDGATVSLAVTAVMTYSFDYTGSDWQPV